MSAGSRRYTRKGQTGRLSISEAQFQDWVIEVARLHGWRLVHFRAARVEVDKETGKERWATPYEGDDGFPDLVLARDGEVIFRELKSHTGKLSKSQQEWLDELGEFGGIWRPGMEAKILQELSRPWTVQRTMQQRGIRLVDLMAMEGVLRQVQGEVANWAQDPDVDHSVAMKAIHDAVFPERAAWSPRSTTGRRGT